MQWAQWAPEHLQAIGRYGCERGCVSFPLACMISSVLFFSIHPSTIVSQTHLQTARVHEFAVSITCISYAA